MAKRVFFSFHYKPDNWRVAMIRSIGAIEGNKAATDNDWESIAKGGDDAIKKWISGQLEGKSCTVLLVGSNTADRKWINYEIVQSWNEKKGIVGIYIHGLKNNDGEVATKGKNPFDFIGYGDAGKKLSSIVKCYDPAGSSSQERYKWIAENLANAIDEAVAIRSKS
jgi:MTH538 TIR-like domain (DUF1863)